MLHPSLRPLGLLLFLAPALSAQDKVDFQTHVLPILEKSCIECHRTTFTDADGRQRRPKGGVAMDTKESFLKGKQGRNGSKPIFVAGKPAESMIIEMVTMPADDEDRMPPPGKKDPLSEAQIKVLERWIEQGADFGTWAGKATVDGTKVEGGDEERGGRGFRPQPREDYITPLAKDLKPLSAETLQKAAGEKGRIEPLREDSPLLRVSFPGHEDEVTDVDLAALAPLADHVVILGLGRTKITDAAAPAIAKMKKLVRLDVRETGVGDASIKTFASLPELRMLNVYGTKMTDKGLADLAKAGKLEQLFVWQTGVSAQAVEKLKQELPKLRVSFAADLPQGERGQGNRRGRGQRGGQARGGRPGEGGGEKGGEGGKGGR